MKAGHLTILAAAAPMLAAACASSRSHKAARAPSAGGGELAVGALSDAALPKGECGMILWTLESQRPTAVFRSTVDGGAEIALNGEVVRLPLVRSSGSSAFGVFEEQEFAAGGVTATVRVQFGLGFEGGSYLERGLLTVESGSGWRSVVPAAGIAGCRGK